MLKVHAASASDFGVRNHAEIGIHFALPTKHVIQFLIEHRPGGVFFTYEYQGLEACPEQEVLDRARTGSGDSSLDPLEVEMLPVGGNDVAVRLERRTA